nr:transposase (putative), gypsy type [Tanacetum cinerariifolium]
MPSPKVSASRLFVKLIKNRQGYNTTRECRINHLPIVFAGVYLRVRRTRGLASVVAWPEETIMDFPKGKVDVYTKFFEFENFRILISQFLFDILGYYQIHLSQLSVIGAAKVDEKIFPTIVDWRISALKDGMPAANLYSAADVTSLDTHRTPILKQPEVLLCLVGLSRRYFLGDDVYLVFLDDDDRDMDLFNLISALNPTKVKTETRPCAAHEVSLLTVTASRVIDMKDVAGGEAEDQAQDEMAYEILPTGNASATEVSLEIGLEKEVAAMGPPVKKRHRKRGNNEAEANAPPKVLRRDYDTFRPVQSTHGGKSLASVGLDADSLLYTPAAQDPSTAIKCVSYLEPLSYANPLSYLEKDIAQSSKGTATEVRIESGRCVSRHGGSHCAIGYFYELRHFPNVDFLDQYNITLAQQVAKGSQLRLRFEQEVRLLKKSRSKIARRDQRIQAKNAKLEKELDSLRAQFSDLQVSNKQLSDQMDARLDKLSVDFDEELYAHILTAIAGRRWVVWYDLRLAVMKCAESSEIRKAFADVVSARLAKGMSKGLKYGIEHGKAGQDLADVEAYDPESNNKLVKALKDLKDLKYPMIDQLEKLKDALIELIMASLYLENLWAVKEEMLLEDAISANISRAEKKKKCRVVCRTYGIGFAHHARSDDILVSAPTIPQGLAILLADAAT